MTRVCACLSIVILLLACSDSRGLPAAPTSISTFNSPTAADAPFPPPAPPGTTRALVGTVRGDGNIPMVGAKVEVLAAGWFGASRVEAATVTDGDGIYTMPNVNLDPSRFRLAVFCQRSLAEIVGWRRETVSR